MYKRQLLDKPFEVDDWIQVEGSLEGVVEDITFRSTRVRTFDKDGYKRQALRFPIGSRMTGDACAMPSL